MLHLMLATPAAIPADPGNTSRLARCVTVNTVLSGALLVLHEQAALVSLKQAILPLCENTTTHPESAAMLRRFQRGINAASTAEPCVMPYHIGPEGEGGKTLCVVKSLFSHGCNVVSVGSNGQVEFETAMHKLWRQCKIDIWDGTLVGSRQHLRRNLPEYARFYPSNFGVDTYLSYNASYERPRHAVTMLKIDCEGCEWHDGFANWLDHVCTDQIILELHITPRTAGADLERMLRRLSSEYALFAGEGNPQCGWLPHTTLVCVELSWIRREPCGTPSL